MPPPTSTSSSSSQNFPILAALERRMPPPGTGGGARARATAQQRGGPTQTAARDTFNMQESIDRRERAARVLGSWEMVAWWSGCGFESIPQTRRRFEKMLIGLDPDEGAELVDEMASDAREEEKLRRKAGGAEGSASASASASASGSGARKMGGKKGKSPTKSGGDEGA